MANEYMKECLEKKERKRGKKRVKKLEKEVIEWIRETYSEKISIVDFRNTLLAITPTDEDKTKSVKLFTECSFLWNDDTLPYGFTTHDDVPYYPKKLIFKYRTWADLSYINFEDSESYTFSLKFLLRLFNCR